MDKKIRVEFKKSGVIPIYKPSGPTSTDVIRTLKRKYKFNKIGHLGTLDPMAEGILPIMINQATKLAPILDTSTKFYKTVMKFGVGTDTNDITGEVISEKKDFLLERADLEKSLLLFSGEIEQVPPKFAAVKINGVRAYKLAREGKDFEIKSKKVTISSIKLKRFSLPYAEIEIECSRGTYIRSIIRDIGESLDIPATMSKLIRSESSNFSIKDSVTLDDAVESLDNKIINIEKLFNFAKLMINDFEYGLIQNGQIPKKIKFPEEGYYQLIYNDKMAAILVQEKEIKIFKVFK